MGRVNLSQEARIQMLEVSVKGVVTNNEILKRQMLELIAQNQQLLANTHDLHERLEKLETLMRPQ